MMINTNITSINGQQGQIGQTNYAASKAAMIGFTKALALESAAKGITVNAVAPGSMATEGAAEMAERRQTAGITAPTDQRSIPLGRRGLPEEIGSAVVFLASELASYVTGQTLLVDGGIYKGL